MRLAWIDNGLYRYDLTNGLKNISMTTKPRLVFHGKLGFNSEITKYELEMESAVAQVILKLKEHMQTGNGCFFFLRRKCHASKRLLYYFRG